MPNISYEPSQEDIDNHHPSQVLKYDTKINPKGRLREHYDSWKMSLEGYESEKIEEGKEKSREVLELGSCHFDHQPQTQDISSSNGEKELHPGSGRNMPVTRPQESYAGEIPDKDQDGIEPQSYQKSKLLSWEHLWLYQDKDRERSLSLQQPHHDAEETKEAPEALRELRDLLKGIMEDNEDSHLIRCGIKIRRERYCCPFKTKQQVVGTS